jgi:hypothetical protein
VGPTKRHAPHAYDSQSGTYLIVANASLQAVAVECLSRCCSKCEYKIAHPLSVCSKNYEGYSKGMEAEGALCNVRILHEEKI